MKRHKHDTGGIGKYTMIHSVKVVIFEFPKSCMCYINQSADSTNERSTFIDVDAVTVTTSMTISIRPVFQKKIFFNTFPHTAIL